MKKDMKLMKKLTKQDDAGKSTIKDYKSLGIDVDKLRADRVDRYGEKNDGVKKS